MVLFGVSLRLPALLFDEHGPLSGGHVLGWGWWGLLTLDFAWFANPAFFLALIAIIAKRYRFAQVGSGIALILGASSFLADEWWFNEGSGTPIAGLGIAFYVWMSSFVVTFLGSYLLSVSGKASRPSS